MVFGKYRDKVLGSQSILSCCSEFIIFSRFIYVQLLRHQHFVQVKGGL